MSVVRTVLRTVRTLRTVTRNNGVPGTDAEGGGATTFAALTDKATADLPAINTPLSSALSGKAATSHTHLSASITDATSAATADKLVLRNGTGGADFAGTVNLAIGVVSDLRFEDYQAAVGATFLYGDGAASAHRTALGSGATGDELFTAATPAAARTTLGFDAAVPKIPITYSNSSDFPTASTSFVDVPGLSFPVAANKNYQVVFHLNTNKNDSNGMQYRITGPASPTRVFGRVIVFTSSTSASAADIPTAFSAASTTFNSFSGDSLAFSSPGIIVSNGANAGTVQLQIRAITGGTAKVYAGSWIQITEL